MMPAHARFAPVIDRTFNVFTTASMHQNTVAPRAVGQSARSADWR
jgi:hypothetical protein